ncbi:hypothetical protein [Kutzneria sp. 744]|uniref:hypothetical protein n=1 Tax=Kutzneria sp. (strain 744) TaxID=345341 RepID=UPI0004B568EA|nr:hypothetical protein [Kutzneria sp. 744]
MTTAHGAAAHPGRDLRPGRGLQQRPGRLDAPVDRVTGGEASPSISKVLERAAVARTEEVVAALHRIRRG